MTNIVQSSNDHKRGVDFIGVCCVFYCHDGNGNFLFHKRSDKCRDEVGCWDAGGGSLEFGETPEEAIRREIREEYGCDVLNVCHGGVRNVLRDNGGTPTHWVSFVYAVQVDPAQVMIGDPEKIDEIGWFALHDLPQPMHSQTESGLALIRDQGES